MFFFYFLMVYTVFLSCPFVLSYPVFTGDLPVCLYVCAFVNQDEGAAKQLSAPVCVCEEAGCGVGWREGERVAWITQVRWEAWWQAWRQTGAVSTAAATAVLRQHQKWSRAA